MTPATALSLAAVGISACSLLVAYLGYRAAGPRVRLQISTTRRPDTVEVFATVVNRGRGPVEIVRFNTEHRLIGSLLTRWRIQSGEELPYRLEGASKRNWRVTLDDVSELDSATNYTLDVIRKTPFIRHVRFVAELGDGRITRAPIWLSIPKKALLSPPGTT